MTKENELNLVKALATKHVGNTKLLKKYNMSCTKTDDILKPFTDKDECPTDDILKKANETFIKEFTEQAIKILENDCNEFINDLVFNTINS